MTIPIGRQRTIPEKDASLLWDDNFDRGPQGWVSLMSSAWPLGQMSMDSRITHQGSRYSLRVDTQDYADGTSFSNWATSTAIKRLWRATSMQSCLAEWVFTYGSRYGGLGEEALAPSQILFGIDTCDFTGSRHYFQLRYLISGRDASANGQTLYQKFQILNTDLITWTDIPGATVPLSVNENKRNLFRVELDLDLTANRYRGLRINSGLGFGSLAATPNNTMSSLPGPLAETLNSFRGSLNVVFGISNRIYGPASNGNATQCWANLAYSKGRVA